EKQWDFSTRFDVNINDKNQIYFRYSQGEQNTFGDIVNGGLQRVPGGPNWVDTFRNPKNFAFNYRWSPTARLANEFIFGLNSFGFQFAQPDPDPSVPFILNNPTDFRQNFAYNARNSRTWQLVDNITFDLAPHTLKFGLNFRFGNQFDDRSGAGGLIEPQILFGTTNSNFTNWNLPSSGINANDVDRLRSTINDLIGRIGTARQGFVVSGANPDAFAPAGTRWNWTAYYPEYDFYVQDSWRFRQNLTLDLGVRWEVKLSPSSKDLPVLTPVQPFTVGSPPSNALRWEEGDLYQNDFDNFSPSLGFAWDPFSSGKTSIRANYRLSYDRFPSQVFANFVFQSAPGNTFQSILTPGPNVDVLLRNGIPNLTPTLSPNQLRQTPAFSTGSIVAVDPNIKFPENHQWFVGFQRELWAGNVLEVNYIGRRGVHLFGAYDVNQVNIFASSQGQTFLDAFLRVRNDPTYSSPLINYLFTGSSGNAAGTGTFRGLTAVQTALAQGAVGSAALVLSQNATVRAREPFFFQPYPQFSGGLNILETNDLSRYNGLEIIMKRRFMNGLSYQASYTYSLSKDTRSWDPTFATANRTGLVGGLPVTPQSSSSTPYNINDRSLNYSWSDFDRRHVWQGYAVYELPIGRGRAFGSDMPRVLDWIVGGWQVSGLFNLGSGRPYTVNSGILTFGNVVNSTVNCSGECPRDLGRLVERNGIWYWFDQDAEGRLTIPGPGELGNTPRNYFIGPRAFNVDGSLSKKFRFNERWSFDLRVDAKNLTNTPTFFLSDAQMTRANPAFGQVNNSVTSFSRRIQFSGKLNF
ncbi:MAG: TonB-dependent receptor domain-containing protein, partial [Pyrinomonadaceae bacterium]